MKTKSEPAHIRAIDKATDWLVRMQRLDGSFGDPVKDIVAYYKAPFALKTTGRIMEANRALEYIKSRLMKQNGDFGGNEGKSLNEYMIEYPVYPNGWIILAAEMLGRLDISLNGLRYALSFYNPDCGGFCTKEPYGSGDNTVDVITTAHLGLVSLYFNHFEKAKTAGDLLATFLDLQPNRNAFLLRMDCSQRLITNFPKVKEKFFIILSSREAQDYFHLGYAMGFLGRLYLATKSQKYLEAAEKYANFVFRCKQDLYSFPENLKIGWGFSTLYALTNEEKYSAATKRIIDEIINHQKERGEWICGSERSNFSDLICFTCALDLVSETIIWLSEMMKLSI